MLNLWPSSSYVNGASRGPGSTSSSSSSSSLENPLAGYPPGPLMVLASSSGQAGGPPSNTESHSLSHHRPPPPPLPHGHHHHHHPSFGISSGVSSGPLPSPVDSFSSPPSSKDAASSSSNSSSTPHGGAPHPQPPPSHSGAPPHSSASLRHAPYSNAPFSNASYMAAFNPALYAAAAARVGGDPAASPFFSQASLFRISAAAGNPFLRPGLGLLNLGAGGAFRPVSGVDSADSAAAAAAAAAAAYHSAFTPAKRSKLSPEGHIIHSPPGAATALSSSGVFPGSSIVHVSSSSSSLGGNGCASSSSAGHSPISPHPLSLVKDERPNSRGSGVNTEGGNSARGGESRCGSSEPDMHRPRRLSFHEGDSPICPICDSTLSKGEFQHHLQLEYERLIQLTRMPLEDKNRSPTPENKSNIESSSSTGSTADSGRQARQETFSRVRSNRQNRLCSRIRQRKRCFQEMPESTALSPVSPSSSHEGHPGGPHPFHPHNLAGVGSPEGSHRSHPNPFHTPGGANNHPSSSSQPMFPGMPPHSLGAPHPSLVTSSPHLPPHHPHLPPPLPHHHHHSHQTSSSSSSAPHPHHSSREAAGSRVGSVCDDEDVEVALDVDGDGDAVTYGRPQYTEDDVRRAAAAGEKRDAGRALSPSTASVSVEGEEKEERTASPESIESEEARLFSEEVQGNMRRLLIEAIANNQKENLNGCNANANNNNASSSSNNSSNLINSSSDGSVSPTSGSETSSPEKQLVGGGCGEVASTSDTGSTTTTSNALVDSASKIVDAFMSNLAKKRASGEKPLGPLEAISGPKRQKCHVCNLHYKSPLLSISCWHVHCERCWLSSLGAKKLCPQCHVITSPSDLRRVFL